MIAFVTSVKALELDEDMAPLVGAMSHLGVPHEVVCWEDAAVDWSKFDAVVVRSTWDYHARIAEYLAWVDRVAKQTRLFNSSEVLHWNTDKRYLEELHKAGIPVVPTTFVIDDHALSELLATGVDWNRCVVKPTVSAGSNDTALHDSHDGAVAHVRQLFAKGKTAMVQPYQSAIDQLGETGLVYMAGKFSHAFYKGPLLAGAVKDRRNSLFLEETIRPERAAPDQLAIGEQIVAFMHQRFGVAPLYMRVDLVPGDDGPVLLELEATEPSLFFNTDPASAERFARCCEDLLKV